MRTIEPAAVLRMLVTAEGVKEAQLQLARLDESAKRTADSTGRMETQFNRLGKAAGNTAGLLAAAAVGAADVAAALGPPLVAAGAGAVGLMSALGQGAVVAKLALSGVGAALQGNKKALADLTPAQRTFVDQLKGMQGRLDGLQQVAAKGMLPGVTVGIRAVLPLINQLKPIFAATAKELGNLATAAGKMVASMSGSFQVIGRANVKILGNLGQAAIAFGQALIGFLAAAAPFTIWMSHAIKLGAQWINNQVTAGQATGRLAAFLDRAKTIMKLLGDTLGNLIKAFFQVTKNMLPFGVELLKIVNGVAKLVAHNPELGKMIAILLNFAAAAKVVSFLVSPLFKIADGVASAVAVFRKLPAAIEAAKVAMVGLSTFIEANPLALPFTVLAGAIAFALTHLKEFKRGVSIAWDSITHTFKDGVATILGFISTFLHGMGSLLDAISNVPGLGWVGGLAKDVNHAGDSIDKLREKLTGVGKEAQKSGKQVSTSWGSAQENLQRAIQQMLRNYGDFHDKVGTDNASLTKNFNTAYKLIESYIATHTGKARDAAKANLAELTRSYGRDMNTITHQTQSSMGSVLSTIGDKTSQAAKQGGDNINTFQQRTQHWLSTARNNTSSSLNAIASIIGSKTSQAASQGGNNMNTLQQRTQHWLSTAHNNTSTNLNAIASIVGSKTSQAASTAGSNMSKFANNIRGGMQQGSSATYHGLQYIAGAVSKGLGALGSAVKMSISLSIPKIGFARGGEVTKAAKGLYQFGDATGQGRDDIPVRVGDQSIMVGSGEMAAVFTRHQKALADRFMAPIGGLSGLFNNVTKPHYMASGGYVYPYPKGTPLGRTDQGVDTGVPAGGLFRAIGDAIIGATNIGGWPGGPLMNWTLQSGPARGRSVYLAEMIRPLVHMGQRVSGSTAVAASTGPSQEMGWWTGGPYGRTLAQATGGYSEGQVTTAGLSFRNFIGGGGIGPALAAIASIIAPHVTGGGVFGKLVNAALSKATNAANAFVQAHAPVGMPGQLGSIPPSSGSVERDIYKTLTSRGWDKVAIAGAIGNAVGESNLNPGAIGSGGGGLWGFTSGAISLAALQAAAASRGVPWTDVPFQSAFMAEHYPAEGSLAVLNAYRDPALAAAYFMNTFERPANPAADIGVRAAAAKTAYAQGYSRGGWLPPYAGSFAGGGMVPGPVGAPRTAIVHGGETISNNNTSGPLVNIEYMNVHDAFDERALAHRLAFLVQM